MLYISNSFDLVTALKERGQRAGVDFLIQKDGTVTHKTAKPAQADLDAAFLAAHKRVKIANMDEVAEKAIRAGFTSGAHTFGFSDYDQANLTAMHTNLVGDTTMLDVNWKTLDAGVVVLTRAEFFTMAKDALAHKQTQIGKFWTQKAKVDAAPAVAEVIAIQF